jgi:NADPH:quinone reductase-like Zn-dependent oxidoreductase
VDPRRALQDWVHAADVRVLKPVIDATSSFAKFREACAHLKHGAFGKLVVKVRNQ